MQENISGCFFSEHSVVGRPTGPRTVTHVYTAGWRLVNIALFISVLSNTTRT